MELVVLSVNVSKHCRNGNDRNKIVYRHHVQKLSQLKPIQDKYESLCQTVHDLTRHASGMKTCDGATLEQLLVAMVEPLFPTVLTILWSDFTSDSHSPPTFADLIKFMKRHSQAVEAIASTTETSSQNQSLTKTVTCRDCGRKHHSLIHKQTSKNSTTSTPTVPPSGVNTSSNQQQSQSVAASNSTTSNVTVTPSGVKKIFVSAAQITHSFLRLHACHCFSYRFSFTKTV